MAEHLLGTILIKSNTAISGLSKGDEVKVYWDDTNERINAYDNEVLVLPSSYGDYGPMPPFYANVSITNTGYSFCASGDLNYFTPNGGGAGYDEFVYTNFPYYQQGVLENAPVCFVTTPTVGDIKYGGNTIITEASSSTAADGTCIINCYSSRTVRATFDKNAIYDSGIIADSSANDKYNFSFTGLAAGDYIVYFIDSAGYRAHREFTVPYQVVANSTNYAKEYYQQWTDADGKKHRIDYYKKGGAGPNTKIQTSGVAPIDISYAMLNKGPGMQASSSVVSLVNTTPWQWITIFKTIKEKEYWIEYRYDVDGADSLYWHGFLTPSLSAEPYNEKVYESTFTATDRLADLSTFPFLQDDQQLINTKTVLELILFCVNKLDINNAFRIGYNLYDTGHNSAATDDPLVQTEIDCETYYRDGIPNCAEVLNAILTSLNARLFSWGAYWYIIRVPELIDAFDYREYTRAGAYSANGTIDSLIDIKKGSASTRAAWANKSATRNVDPSFKNVNIVQNLDVKESIAPLLAEVNLEEKRRYLANTSLGRSPFIGWTPTMPEGSSGNISVKPKPAGFETIGIRKSKKSIGKQILRAIVDYNLSAKKAINQINPYRKNTGLARITEEKENEYSFEFDFAIGQGLVNENDPVIAPYVVTNGHNSVIEFSKDDKFSLSAEILYILPSPNFVTQRFKWRLKVGTKYYNQSLDNGEDNAWSTTEVDNYYWITEVNSTIDINIVGSMDKTQADVTSLTWELRLYHIDLLDCDIYFDLAAKPDIKTTLQGTTTVDVYNVGDPIILTSNRDDYEQIFAYQLQEHAATEDDLKTVKPTDNTDLRWVLLGNAKYKTNIRPLFYINGVYLTTLPSGQEWPDEEIKTFAIDPDNILEFDYDLYHFDAPPELNNAENMIKNHFKLANGNPTGAWSYNGVGNEKQIQDILAEEIAEMNKNPTDRITGELITDTQIFPYSVLRESDDSNVIYMIDGFTYTAMGTGKSIIRGDFIEIGSNDGATTQLGSSVKSHKDNAHDSGHN